LNIASNEEANKAVKEGATLPYLIKPYYTLASLKRLVKEKAKDSLVQL
jgi:D-alanine-D-alanine ligase-like ATP-grasp enzyme